MFSLSRPDALVYEQERKEANALPHRRQRLETAIVNLQLGPFAPRVHALLDRHLAALPPRSEQDDGDRVWRLTIHRMDTRQYAISPAGEQEALADDGDRWEEMSGGQRDWCVDVVCSEVLRGADHWDPYNHIYHSVTGADRACASVTVSLLQRQLSPEHNARVREAFVAALTHPIDDVRWSATRRIDERFWATDRDLAIRCVNAIATEATLLEHAWQVEESRSYEQPRQPEIITAEVARVVRERFWEDDLIVEDAHQNLDISEGAGAHALVRMLAILGEVSDEPVTVAAFVRASRTLVEWWDAGDDRRHRRDRDFHNEAAVAERLQDYLMRATPSSALEVLRPVLDAMDRHPREIYTIVNGLRGIEDSRPNTRQYWFLWALFAEAVKQAKWISRLHDRRPIGSEMLSAIFLTTFWKDNVRHWRSLEGYAHHVHHLFEALPPSSCWTITCASSTTSVSARSPTRSSGSPVR
jgi:hypothetical protein